MSNLSKAKQTIGLTPRTSKEERDLKVKIAYNEGALAGSLIYGDKEIAGAAFELLVKLGARHGKFDFKKLRYDLMEDLRKEVLSF